MNKALKIQGASAPCGDRERLQRVCTSPYGYEFLGIHMDTCSVGTCSANFAKWGLGHYVEPIYDGLHGIHRAIFRALDEGDLWHIFLIMRLLYTFAWAPWLGGKYLVEQRECIEELMRTHPQELRKLFDLFVPGIAVDMDDPSFAHDKARQDELFSNYTKSDLCNFLGPRMAICGWMSYYYGATYWDPRHNLRAFGIAAWAARRGLFGRRFTQISLAMEVCEKSAPAETKKAAEVVMAEVKALKADQVKAMAQLYLQGWGLQRKIRLIKTATHSSERRFHYLHTGSRGQAASLQHFSYLASPRGLDHVRQVFIEFENCKTLRYLGMITVDSDLPYILDKSRATQFVLNESSLYQQDFKVKVALSGALLRRSLWHTEGLPGHRWMLVLLQ